MTDKALWVLGFVVAFPFAVRLAVYVNERIEAWLPAEGKET